MTARTITNENRETRPYGDMIDSLRRQFRMMEARLGGVEAGMRGDPLGLHVARLHWNAEGVVNDTNLNRVGQNIDRYTNQYIMRYNHKRSPAIVTSRRYANMADLVRDIAYGRIPCIRVLLSYSTYEVKGGTDIEIDEAALTANVREPDLITMHCAPPRIGPLETLHSEIFYLPILGGDYPKPKPDLRMPMYFQWDLGNYNATTDTWSMVNELWLYGRNVQDAVVPQGLLFSNNAQNARVGCFALDIFAVV